MSLEAPYDRQNIEYENNSQNTPVTRKRRSIIDSRTKKIIIEKHKDGVPISRIAKNLELNNKSSHRSYECLKILEE
jgi:hypothetical protein